VNLPVCPGADHAVGTESREARFKRNRVPTIFWYRNSRTLKDREVAFSGTSSRRKFTAWTVLQQYLISISVITGQF